jgi:hypothetical protein
MHTGESLHIRLQAIKAEMARIQELETRYHLKSAHSHMEKSAHEARRAALESMKEELVSLLPIGSATRMHRPLSPT